MVGLAEIPLRRGQSIGEVQRWKEAAINDSSTAEQTKRQGNRHLAKNKQIYKQTNKGEKLQKKTNNDIGTVKQTKRQGNKHLVKSKQRRKNLNKQTMTGAD